MVLREIRDGSGTVWSVFMVNPDSSGTEADAAPADRASGWLCFLAGDRRRRLAGVPVGWETAADQHLLQLLDHAEDSRPDGSTGRIGVRWMR